jgi:hypothetical protein
MLTFITTIIMQLRSTCLSLFVGNAGVILCYNFGSWHTRQTCKDFLSITLSVSSGNQGQYNQVSKFNIGVFHS